MAATVIPLGSHRPDPAAVALILSDGSVVAVGGPGRGASVGSNRWAQGTVSGEGWTLWWERRSFRPTK